MALALKVEEINGKSYAVLTDGKPTYIDDSDGKELGFDLSQLHGKISDLNAEAKKHRLHAQELKDNLEKFGAIKPEEITSLQSQIDELGGSEGIAKLKAQGNVDVEAIKKSISDAAEAKIRNLSEAYEAKLAESGKSIENLTARERQLLIGNGFATSRFINDKTILTPDFAEAYFGKYFKIEDGKAVAYIGDNMICSRENPCDPAPMDEALAIIVDQYPMKDRILRGSGASGSGSQQSNATGNSGAKTISRGDFERLPPAKQAEIALSRTIQITD